MSPLRTISAISAMVFFFRKRLIRSEANENEFVREMVQTISVLAKTRHDGNIIIGWNSHSRYNLCRPALNCALSQGGSISAAFTFGYFSRAVLASLPLAALPSAQSHAAGYPALFLANGPTDC